MNSAEILDAANTRARQMGLTYEGALLPAEAYQLLQEIPGTALVDVRTQAEWDWVGRIPGAVEIELMQYPASELNPHFIDELARQVSKDAPVMFICRSGGRSHNAAMMAGEAGFTRCYNVLEGFEGDKDAAGHRGNRGGWRFAGLPWTQG